MNLFPRRLCGLTILPTTALVLGLGFSVNVSADTSADCFETNHIKTTLIKVSEWQLQHLPPRHQPLGAANGVFHTGLIAAHTATGNEALPKAVLAMGEANQWKPGPKLMFPDHHIISNPYIELYRLRQAPRMISSRPQGLRRRI